MDTQNLFTNVHSNIIQNRKWKKNPKCPSTDECINKMWWYMQTMKYYSAIKRNDITIYTNIKSLCCTPKTNLMLYVNYPSIFKKE